ncbi:DUF302 domain-containing protein [Pseudogracilibacillus auburnensis]|uniref:DUF302 domain-containing protein n=1 Tax=Pseudogracilibacillus auburnensis TaxID=1494959 RepID=UPI001A96928D|nr:DUF302 domain-containing protein [Pseudogracilibacillus auburnensis]MBO1001682.1 DUF302 domain-containing protein [Pseudogracilibacillus auburnensis]
MFHYTVETDQSIEQAIKALEASLKEEKFGVLWEFDIRKTLEEKGFAFDKNFIVLEVCNPKEAQEVLTRNHMVGYFLPCKIVVYEDSGKTKIGMPKPSALIQMVEDDELKVFAKNIEDRLIACIDKSVA